MHSNYPIEKYCAYLRKSRADRDAEDRGEGDTLARHQKLLEEFSLRIGFPIEKFYREVVSGDTIADRPVMQELLSDVERGIWSGVFVVEVERLARGNTRDQGIVSDCFKYSGTKILTPNKTYDPNNEFDEEYFEFGLFMARREYKTINRRLQRGRIASVREGKYVGSTAPYGYDRMKINGEKGYTLSINDDEAEVVRMVFDWYCNGLLLDDGSRALLGTDSIASRLDSLGIRPRFSEKWSKATINDMLSNPAYCGDVRFGYRPYQKKMQDGNVSSSRVINEKCQWNPGMHPAIIERSLFEKAQEIKRQKRKYTVPSSKILQNPLSGLVYCKKCNAMMTRLAPSKRNKYATLKCPNKYCDNVSSPIFLIEDQLLLFLREWLESYRMDSDSSESIPPASKEIEILQAAVAKNNSEISKLDSQLNKAYSFLEQEIYTVDVFRERQRLLTKDINSLQESNEKIISEIKRYNDLQYSSEQIIPRLTHLLEVYQNSSPAVCNELLKELILRIEYYKDTPNTRGHLDYINFTLDIHPKLPE